MPDAAAARPIPSPAPFRSGEEAWLWTSRMLAARRQARLQGRMTPFDQGPRRCCTPEDVLQCLAQLYRAGRIDFVHAHVLRRWGERGCAPSSKNGGDRGDYRQWREALDRLEERLRLRGIVAGWSFESMATSGSSENLMVSGENKHRAMNNALTRDSTSGSFLSEANPGGSLIADRATGVSRRRRTKPLPLAAISPPNPDQLRVTPTGVTLSFLVRSGDPSTLNCKEI
jgi:hypothetical protein